MASRPSYSEELKARALELVETGMLFPDVLAQVKQEYPNETEKLAKSTITRWAKDAGIATVAPEATRAANEVRSASLRERRQELASLLMDDAFELRGRLKGPALVYAFGGKDNTYSEEVISAPPATDVRAIAGSIGTLMTQIGKVIDSEPSTNTEEKKSLLAQYADAVGMMPFQEDELEVLDDLDDTSEGSGATTEAPVLPEAD